METCAISPAACGPRRDESTPRASVITHEDRAWGLPCEPLPDVLPGGLVTLGIAPLRYPIAHRNIALLHGLVTALLGEGHRNGVANFSLSPWPEGCNWRLYIGTDAWRPVVDKLHDGRIADQPVRVLVSPLRRAEIARASPGMRRVRILTHTPVVIRCTGSKVTRAVPDDVALQSALVEMMSTRFGARVERSRFALRILEDHTAPVGTPLGGKLQTVQGWRGVLVCEVNATALRLLRVAEIVGLGGRTAYGFGAIVVEELS